MTAPEGPPFGEGNRSTHPVDVLIRELIRTRRPASSEETAAIGERMASAPFDPRIVRVRMSDRELRLHGRLLGQRVSSLSYHLFKRVLIDKQWPTHTTEDSYLRDLRAAVMAPTVRRLVYFDRGGHIAGADFEG